ncbi:MAG TPA: hypothetical protein VF553_01860 [Pyrinomonadaceae bacterium]|jgi:hypothetical protein
MKISFEFNVNGFDLHPAHLARMLLDIQHLVIICAALAEAPLQGDNLVFDVNKQKYKKLIEATSDDLGEAELTVSRIKMESPLLIEVATKLREGVKKHFATAFYYVRDNILFVDLKREEMAVGIEARREEVIEKRIKNAADALNLVEKIPDPQLRNEFVAGLSRTLLSFAIEHPPIKSVNLIEYDKGSESELTPKPKVQERVDSSLSQPVKQEVAVEKQTSSARATVDWRQLSGRMAKPILLTLLLLLFLFLILNVYVYVRLHA